MGCFPMLMAVFGFVMVVVCWLLFAIFLGGGAFFDDTCVQLQLWYDCNAGDSRPTVSECAECALDEMISCPNNATFTDPYVTALTELNTLISAYNSAYQSQSTYITFQDVQLSNSSVTDYSANDGYRTAAYTAVASQYSGCAIPDGNNTAVNSDCLTSCTSTDVSSPSTQECYEKAILSATDVLLGTSYVASCYYLTDLAYAATASGSSCSIMSNGFIYQFGANGAIGVLYFAVIGIGIAGFDFWNGSNNKENSERAQAREASDRDANMRHAVGGARSLNKEKTHADIAEARANEDFVPFAEKHGRTGAAPWREFINGWYSTWNKASKPGPPPEFHCQNMLSSDWPKVAYHRAEDIDA